MSSPDPTRIRKKRRRKEGFDIFDTLSRQELKRLTIAAVVIILSVFGIALYFLRQAAARMDATHRIMQAESDCAALVPKAVHLITQADAAKGLEDRVTETANHYNQLTHQCYVEVTTYQHEESAIFTKTLISVTEDNAILWSVSGAGADPGRQCFGANATPLNCSEADKRWKAFMSQ